VTRKKGVPLANSAASVKARLLQRAHEDGEDFNSLLVRYVLERSSTGSEPPSTRTISC